MEKPSSSTGNPNNVDDNTMTLGDFLEQELQLENDANAVLGGCDDEHCTYDMGYVPRQALYSCKTCTKDAPPAGICLACSYHCHEGHELVELYTKRYFRCDCGNNKFGGLKCSLTPIKDRENEKNHYNQNFQGLYCSCARPYPDPEDEVGDDMIQCCVCEDWYHSRHLNVEFPGEENYAEMICTSCTTRLTFLGNYRFLSVNDADKTEDAVVDVVNNAEENENKVVKAGAEDQTSQQEVHCKIQNPTEKPFEGVATFWMSNFRSFLCKCPKCKVMYEKLNVSWITNESDTVHAYEEKGKSNGEQGSKPSQYEQGMQALAGMDRVQQMEAILNYNDLKSNLKAYLAKFAENKKVVREEDIKEFFTQMQARKRQKLDVGVPPFVCH